MSTFIGFIGFVYTGAIAYVGFTVGRRYERGTGWLSKLFKKTSS